MPKKGCDIFDRLLAWPSPPTRHRPLPLNVDMKGNGRRSTPQEPPSAPGTARKDEPEIILPETLTRAFRQTGELHELLGTLDAALQQARVRVHIVESELAKIAEEKIR